MSKPLFVIGLVLLLIGCQPEPPQPAVPDVEYLNPPSAAGRSRPFTEAVRVGNMLYLSGKIGSIPGGGGLAPGGIQPETRQVLENIKDALERYGSSMDRVVKCTVFLADIGEWAQMNEVYTTFFPDHPPARSALGVSGLAAGARVEIECIATLAPQPTE
ncbi:MAG: RidA family protein [Rhodothermales bacterium]